MLLLFVVAAVAAAVAALAVDAASAVAAPVAAPGGLGFILMQALHAKNVPIKIKKTMDEVENTSLKRWTRLQHLQHVAAPQ